MSDYKNKHYRHSGKGRRLKEEVSKNLNLWNLVDDSEEELEDKDDEEKDF